MAESKSEKSCERLFPTSWQFPKIARTTGAWLAIWHVWLHVILHKCHVLISFILLFPTLTCVFFARNLFEKLQRATVSVKRAEKRSDIEDISLRENVSETYTRFCWVHGGDMVAHGLTKFGEKHQMFDRIAEIREGKEKTGHSAHGTTSRRIDQGHTTRSQARTTNQHSAKTETLGRMIVSFGFGAVVLF